MCSGLCASDDLYDEFLATMSIISAANSLILLLNIGSSEHQKAIVAYSKSLASETKLGLLPAFWPPIFQEDEHWNLLKNNCK